eukprot:comp11564_c0_seq1/m.6033 comp11564_c0_seq1/g.6033  ORF comp11564_c0_seq1/g.6033 comp11564_c0_seq1/m.6033 type:complete len:617 (-) comp11564_c0_seq1:724-2574(-)
MVIASGHGDLGPPSPTTINPFGVPRGSGRKLGSRVMSVRTRTVWGLLVMLLVAAALVEREYLWATGADTPATTMLHARSETANQIDGNEYQTTKPPIALTLSKQDTTKKTLNVKNVYVSRMGKNFWCLPGGQRWTRDARGRVGGLVDVRNYAVWVGGLEAPPTVQMLAGKTLDVLVQRTNQTAPTCSDSIMVHVIGPAIVTSILQPANEAPDNGVCFYRQPITVEQEGKYDLRVVLDYINGRAALNENYDRMDVGVWSEHAYKQMSADENLNDVTGFIPGTPLVALDPSSPLAGTTTSLPHPVLGLPLHPPMSVEALGVGEVCALIPLPCGPGMQPGRWIHHVYVPKCATDLTTDDDYVWVPSKCKLKRYNPKRLINATETYMGSNALRVLVVGDDTMADLAAAMGDVTRGNVGNLQIIHEHIDNITDAISRIPNILEDTTPHVVLINSMSRDMPHATHAQYLESVNLLLGILDRWQSDPTEGLSPRQVMWAHTMAVHEGLRPRAFVNSYHIRQLSVQVESIATQHRIPTIDLFSATFGRPDRSWDGMHVRAPQSRRPSRSARATTATTVTREQFCAGDWYGREFDPQAYPPTMTRTVAQIAYNTIFNVWAERVGY